MTTALFAILVYGEVDVELWLNAEFQRIDNGPEDDCDWRLVKATCFRMIVSPSYASHEIIDMVERYQDGDGGADYLDLSTQPFGTEWLRAEIKHDRNGSPSVHKLTELRHMVTPRFIKDSVSVGLMTLLDSIHERETQPDPGGDADRFSTD